MTRADGHCAAEQGARRRGGFTMIEVVAAVAILGIWFTLLLRIVSDGVATETLNRVRLEASLIADEALADAEASLLAGGVVSELTRGQEHNYGHFADAEYDVVLTSSPFDPLGSLAPREGAYVPAEGLGLDLSKLTAEQQQAALAALLEIHVEVYQAEGAGDIEFDFGASDGDAPQPFATRTTYIIDPLVIAGLGLEAAAGGAPGAGGSPTNRPDDRPLGSSGSSQ